MCSHRIRGSILGGKSVIHQQSGRVAADNPRGDVNYLVLSDSPLYTMGQVSARDPTPSGAWSAAAAVITNIRMSYISIVL